MFLLNATNLISCALIAISLNWLLVANAALPYDDFDVEMSKKFGFEQYFVNKGMIKSGLMIEAYDTVNSALKSKADGATIEDAIKEANDKKTRFPGYKEAMNNMIDLLTSLRDMKGKCDLESISVLRQLFKASDTRARAHGDDYKPVRPLDKIVVAEAIEHANSCGYHYQKTFKERLVKMDAGLYDKLDSIADTVTCMDDGKTCDERNLLDEIKQSPDRILTWIMKGDKDPNYTDKKFIFMLRDIKMKNKGHPKRKYLGQVDDELKGVKEVDTTKFVEAVDEFLFDPCYEYLEIMGVDLLVPAVFHVGVLNKSFKALDDADQLFKFNKGLVFYRMCNRLIERRKDAMQLMYEHAEKTASKPANFSQFLQQSMLRSRRL